MEAQKKLPTDFVFDMVLIYDLFPISVSDVP